MTCTRTCDQQRQPYPSPWRCNEGCFFNEADLTPHDKAARQFADGNHEHSPGYIWWIDGPLEWFSGLPWYDKALVVGFTVLACCLTGLALVGLR